MKAIILAAGYATRLWPLTLNKPKPLLLVGKKNRPILEYILMKLEAIRYISEIYIVTNSKFVKNFKKWKAGYKIKQKISIIDDGMKRLDERRGSIGDIIFSIEKKKPSSDILVVAGDNIFDFGLSDFIKVSRGNGPFATIGLFDVRLKKLAREYGIVELNRNSRVVSFKEKPARPNSTLAAMCLYYFPKRIYSLIRRYHAEGNALDLAGNFIKWLAKQDKVYGHVFKGVWLDIGDKSSLQAAQGFSWDR